jgi:hypothetical protein
MERLWSAIAEIDSTFGADNRALDNEAGNQDP